MIKILGERNSGTTYLDRLLRRNLRVRILPGVLPKPIERLFPTSERVRDLYFRATRRHNLGWKHAAAPRPGELADAAIDPSEILFLVLTKNPYSWLLSLHRRPYHAKQRHRDFDVFLKSPWPTLGRENARTSFETPIDLWNAKNASYLDLAAGAEVLALRYEDLLRDPFDILDRLVRTHRFEARRSPFENIEEAAKPGDRDRRSSDYRDYYLGERWKQELSPSSLAWINSRLDQDLMERLGYPLIDPAAPEAPRNP